MKIARLTDIEREKATNPERLRLRHILDKGKEMECSLNQERFRDRSSCEVLDRLARNTGLSGLFVDEDIGERRFFVKDGFLMASPDALEVADRLLSCADSARWKEGFDYLIDFLKYLERAECETRIKGREPDAIAHTKAWAIRGDYDEQIEDTAARALLIQEYLGEKRLEIKVLEQLFQEIEDDCAKKVIGRIDLISRHDADGHI